MYKARSRTANAHARSILADPRTPSRAKFFTGIRVWEASCLNCHDTHTVPG